MMIVFANNLQRKSSNEVNRRPKHTRKVIALKMTL
jgi:hypothetical protein